MAPRHRKKEKPPKHHKREIECVVSSLETLKIREKEASGRADIHLQCFQASREREKTIEEMLADANERNAYLEQLVAAYEQDDEEQRLLTEKSEALGCEGRVEVEGGEEEQGHEEGSNEESSVERKADEEGDDDDEGVDEEEGYDKEGYVAEEHGEEGAHEESVDEDQNVELNSREYTIFVQYHEDLVQSHNKLQKDHDTLQQQSQDDYGKLRELYEELGRRYDKEKESCKIVQEQLTECVKAKDELNGKYLKSNETNTIWFQNYSSLRKRFKDVQLKEEESKPLLEAAKTNYEELSQTHDNLQQTHQEMSLKYEEMEKALRATESKNQEHRNNIDGMAEDLLKLRIKWRRAQA